MHPRWSSRRTARLTALDKPERFYSRERLTFTVFAAMALAALCTVGLAMTGAFTAGDSPGATSYTDTVP
ncbi:hypothetical protein ME763_06195 [Streptomyces murinus]|uniref:hypothetical protein n=1 Tax=Streptomyces murinus TaxID=33900 RepID=UPI000A1E8842|nr:hypothetical protein [Streptomyces murinus]WDO05272.1 hypothetical protein ME763_06195 [Streptomyces murinus]